MTFDPTKPVVCRNGCKAKILATDLSGEMPILAKITDQDGRRIAGLYRTDGTYSMKKDYDLINVPEKVTRWIVSGRLRGDYRLQMHRPHELPNFDDKTTCYPIEIEVGRKE